MDIRRAKKKYTLYLIVLLFLISTAVSTILLSKSQTILVWDEQSTGRAVVQLIILQQSYLTLLDKYQRDEVSYEIILLHYDLTWSAYETILNGISNAHFKSKPQKLLKLKNHFKQFQETDPLQVKRFNERLNNVLNITRQAHSYVIELLNDEYHSITQQRNARDIALSKINKQIALSLVGMSLSATLFLVIIFTDKRRMAYLAYHDPLTKLNNRIALQEKITKLQLAKVNFCALLIDIDRFKSINDNYGHDIGDKLLIHIAQKMSEVCGKNSFLGRLGGDEFAVVYRSKRTIETVPLKLLEITKKPIIIDGYDCDVGLSIGISCALPTHKKWVDVLKDADQAMYQAKEKGGNQYQIYHAIPITNKSDC